MTLTREQVDEILIGLWTAVGGDQARQDGLAVMATYDALRQELEHAKNNANFKAFTLECEEKLKAQDDAAQLRQRVEELEQKYKDVCSGWDTQYVTRFEQQVADLTAKLAALTPRRTR